jgi:hypothetical protein
MTMSSRHTRVKVASLTLFVAVAGLATAGPAMAAPEQTAATAAGAPQESVVLTDFVDLPTSPLLADSKTHEVTVTYRNDSSVDRTVAPQLLVESPDAGPFLSPADVKVQRRTAHGCWETVELGTQTGTLFTDLPTAQRTLHAGRTLTEHYRITVLNPQAEGTVHPRVALYG